VDFLYWKETGLSKKERRPLIQNTRGTGREKERREKKELVSKLMLRIKKNRVALYERERKRNH